MVVSYVAPVPAGREEIAYMVSTQPHKPV